MAVLTTKAYVEAARFSAGSVKATKAYVEAARFSAGSVKATKAYVEVVSSLEAAEVTDAVNASAVSMEVAFGSGPVIVNSANLYIEAFLSERVGRAEPRVRRRPLLALFGHDRNII